MNSTAQALAEQTTRDASEICFVADINEIPVVLGRPFDGTVTFLFDDMSTLVIYADDTLEAWDNF